MAGGYNLATYAVSPISQGSAHWAGGLFYGSFILELLDELFVTHIVTQLSVLCSLRETGFCMSVPLNREWFCITLSYFTTPFGYVDMFDFTFLYNPE